MVFLHVHLKYHIGRIERGLAVMGCVVDLVRALYSIKRGQVEKPLAFLGFPLERRTFR